MTVFRSKETRNLALAACAILAIAGAISGFSVSFAMRKAEIEYRGALPALAGKSVRVVMRHGYEPEGRIVRVRPDEGVVVLLGNGDQVSVREAKALKGLAGEETRAVTFTVERSQVAQTLFLGVFGLSASALGLVFLLWRRFSRGASAHGHDTAVALFI